MRLTARSGLQRHCRTLSIPARPRQRPDWHYPWHVARRLAYGFLTREARRFPLSPRQRETPREPFVQDPEALPIRPGASHQKFDYDNPTAAASPAGPNSDASSLSQATRRTDGGRFSSILCVLKRPFAPTGLALRGLLAAHCTAGKACVDASSAA